MYMKGFGIYIKINIFIYIYILLLLLRRLDIFYPNIFIYFLIFNMKFVLKKQYFEWLLYVYMNLIFNLEYIF